MVSIEREVFPRLVGNGLYGHALDGYWMDIGTPGALPPGELGHPRGPSADGGGGPSRRRRSLARGRCDDRRPGIDRRPGGGRPRVGGGRRRDRVELGGPCRLADRARGRGLRLDPRPRRADRRGGEHRPWRGDRRGCPGGGRCGARGGGAGWRRGSSSLDRQRSLEPARRRPCSAGPPQRRPVEGRVGPDRAVRRAGRPGGVRDGRLRDRRGPRGRRIRQPAVAPADHRARVRASIRHAPRPRRAVLELLRGHGGDDRLLRGRRGARREEDRRDHGRSPRQGCARRRRDRDRPAGGAPAPRRGRIPVHGRRGGRRPHRSGAGHPHRDRQRRGASEGGRAGPRDARGRAGRAADGLRPGDLWRRSDRAGRPALEDPGQREREAPRVHGVPARGRPQRDRGLGRRRGGGADERDLPGGPRPAPARAPAIRGDRGHGGAGRPSRDPHRDRGREPHREAPVGGDAGRPAFAPVRARPEAWTRRRSSSSTG